MTRRNFIRFAAVAIFAAAVCNKDDDLEDG